MVSKEASEKKSGMMFRMLIICLIQLALPFLSSAKVPAIPRINCASTNAAGAITLQWEADPGNADHYTIYWSAVATGPYSPETPPGGGATASWQLTGVNGNKVQYYFFVRAYDAAGNSSGASDTVSNILLKMPLIAKSKGIANLEWNAFDTSKPGINHVVRTDPDGKSKTFNLMAGLSFRDTITSPYCDSIYLTYRVENTGSCISGSNAMTNLFLDIIQPVDAFMDSISIDPNGHPVISWIPSISNDVGGYRIEQSLKGGFWSLIGISRGNLITSYASDSMNACKVIKTFAVITLDQCKNRSTGEHSYPHALSTLRMDQPSVNECKGTALLNWNTYKNMNPALGGYRIYRKEGSKPLALIGSTTPSVTTFTDEKGFTLGTSYHYFVRAFSLDGQRSSSSCPVGFTFTSLPRPDTLSLTYASVTDHQTIRMGIHFNPLETVTSIRVLRSDTVTGPFDTIASIAPRSFYDDTTAAINRRSYYYKIDALDKCGSLTRSSGLTRTIFLTCHTNGDESHALSWNAYEGWRGGIDHYEIYRFVNNIPDQANPISTLTGITTYTDPPAASLSGSDVVSYYVKAIEAKVNVLTESISNTVMARQQPLVLLPNAFIPRGIKNNRFRPVMDYFVDEGNYQLMVYNKWWQQVFISRDKSIGWDGKFNGDYAPGGIYYYRLNYKSLTGNSYTKTGVLLLVE